MRKVITLVCLLVIATLAVTVNAGFYREPSTFTGASHTRWVTGTPSPVCLWQRDVNDDAYPVTRPVITHDSIKVYIDSAEVATNTLYNTGIWLWDANDDVYANGDVTYDPTVSKTQYAQWYDVDFEVDANGDIYTKQ